MEDKGAGVGGGAEKEGWIERERRAKEEEGGRKGAKSGKKGVRREGRRRGSRIRSRIRRGERGEQGKGIGDRGCGGG